MPLGMQVSLGPGHIVLDGDAAFPKKDTVPNFRPVSVVAKRLYMDQDATWYGGRPRRMPHCVRWEPAPPHEMGTEAPSFLPMSIVAKRSPISATAKLLFSGLASISIRHCSYITMACKNFM